MVNVGRREGDFFGVGGRERFRRDLRKQQQYQCQNACGNGDTRVTVESIADIGGQLGDQHVDEIVAEQNQRDQLVRPCQQTHGPASTAVLACGQVFQPVAVQAHQAGLGTREKTRQQNQHDECDQEPI